MLLNVPCVMWSSYSIWACHQKMVTLSCFSQEWTSQCVALVLISVFGLIVQRANNWQTGCSALSVRLLMICMNPLPITNVLKCLLKREKSQFEISLILFRYWIIKNVELSFVFKLSDSWQVESVIHQGLFSDHSVRSSWWLVSSFSRHFKPLNS